MLKLAEQLAKLKNTKVIAHQIYGDEIVFVLESGPKLRYTEAQLQTEIEKLSPKPEPSQEPKAKKAKEPKV